MSRALLLFLSLRVAVAADSVPYSTEVRSILDRNCTGCHNHGVLDKPALSGGLALDSYAAVMRGGKRPVVVSGDSGGSELVRRLETTDASLRMPRGGAPLPDASIHAIRRWIDSGAKEGAALTPAAPADAKAVTPISVEFIDVFIPFGKRSPIKGSQFQENEEEPSVFAVPGALHVEDEGGAEHIATQAHKEGIDLKIGPLPPTTAVAFSPDGKYLLLGTAGRLTVWNLERRVVVHELNDMAGSVNSIEFSPDGKLLSVAGGRPFAPGEIRFYDPRSSWKSVGAVAAHKEVILDQAFSPDSTRLATVGFDKAVEIWDVVQRKRLAAILDHSDTVLCVAFHPDGKSIASGGMDRTVKLSDGSTGRGQLTINPELKGILAVAFSPDGKFVLTAGESPEIRWWELATIGESVTERGWKPMRKLPGHSAPVHDMRFSPNGELLATASADRTVRLWSARTGRNIRTLVDADDLLYSVAFSPDSSRLAASGGDGLTRVWDVASGSLLLVLAQKALSPKESSEWVAVSPDGQYSASQRLKGLIRPRRLERAKSN